MCERGRGDEKRKQGVGGEREGRQRPATLRPTDKLELRQCRLVLLVSKTRWKEFVCIRCSRLTISRDARASIQHTGRLVCYTTQKLRHRHRLSYLRLSVSDREVPGRRAALYYDRNNDLRQIVGRITWFSDDVVPAANRRHPWQWRHQVFSPVRFLCKTAVASSLRASVQILGQRNVITIIIITTHK